MCTACDHRQRQSIDQDLSADFDQIPWRALRQKYGIHHLALIQHKREHMKPAAYSPVISSSHDKNVDGRLAGVDEKAQPEAYDRISIAQRINAEIDLQDEIGIQRRAEHGFRECWQQLDTPHRQRNLAWLQEQLCSDEMGL